MGKISELDMAIRDLRSAAATINDVADSILCPGRKSRRQRKPEMAHQEEF